jgi:hypothetical protein
MSKCELLKPLRQKKAAAPIRATAWPGFNRGWGPVTRELEGEWSI